MVKRILLFVVLSIAVLGMAVIVKLSGNSDGFIIMAGKENIDYIKADNAIGVFSNNKIEVFKDAFDSNALANAKYVKDDEKIYIDFGSNPPDKLLIKDNILRTNGEYMYTERETADVPYTNENNKFVFIVKMHPASIYSSYYIDNKTDLRGFRVKASWGNTECVYIFVIKATAFQVFKSN